MAPVAGRAFWTGSLASRLRRRRAGAAPAAAQALRDREGRLRRHRQRHRLLPRAQEGLLPRRRAQRRAHPDGERAADDRAARHGPARRRRRHGGGEPLQRGGAEHRDPRGRRQRLDAQGLRLLRPDGAQGPGRQRPLQDLRRPQGHEARGRHLRQRQCVGHERGAQEGRASTGRTPPASWRSHSRSTSSPIRTRRSTRA